MQLNNSPLFLLRKGTSLDIRSQIVCPAQATALTTTNKPCILQMLKMKFRQMEVLCKNININGIYIKTLHSRTPFLTIFACNFSFMGTKHKKYIYFMYPHGHAQKQRIYTFKCGVCIHITDQRAREAHANSHAHFSGCNL